MGPLTAKLAALERDLQTFLESEADRSANASRIVLTLELANLKRAIDRGERYADELARAKKVGGHAQPHGARALHAGGRAGAGRSWRNRSARWPTPCSTRRPSRADATLVDRLLAGARSIVRVRKTGHAADDTSVEAVIGRMEAALKDGRLAEVLAKAKKLPPKAALAGEDWVKKVEARQAVEQALAEVEAALKASLGPGPRRRHGRASDDPHRPLSARDAGDRRRPALAGRSARAPSSSSGRATSPRPACSAPSSCCCC